MNTDVKAIQQALRDAGFDPGSIDGIIGRNTIAAIKKFQASKNLQVDGIVGKQTRKALGLDKEPSIKNEDIPTFIPWLSEARRLIGLKEVVGHTSNPTILQMAQDLDIDYKDDDIAWCGLFVAHCIASQLPDESLPNNPLGARNWAKFGKEISPSLGAIMVFWRGKKDGWQGHVGFYYGEDNKNYYILGGNQGNSVSIAKIDKTRLLAARWPSTAPHYSVKRIVAANGTAQSTNEA